MVLIRFPDADSERRALGFLSGRFSFKSRSSGEMIVPETALAYLVSENITFCTVELKVFEQSSEANDDSNAFGGKSLAEMIQEIGTVEGLPADLSTNPAYLQGFGEVKNRRTLEP